jgi:UV DNA damage repair endonuclease
MDLMNLDRTHLYPINIHVNTTQPTKEEAAERFCNNFSLLPEGVKSRLVVEVDDKRSQYTSVDLYEMVHKKIGIPITFDYLHNNTILLIYYNLISQLFDYNFYPDFLILKFVLS